MLALLSVMPAFLIRGFVRGVFNCSGVALGVCVLFLHFVPVAFILGSWKRGIRIYAKAGTNLPKEKIFLMTILLSLIWHSCVFLSYWVYWEPSIEEDESVWAVATTIPVACFLLVVIGFLSDRLSTYYIRKRNKSIHKMFL